MPADMTKVSRGDGSGHHWKKLGMVMVISRIHLLHLSLCLGQGYDQ